MISLLEIEDKYKSTRVPEPKNYAEIMPIAGVALIQRYWNIDNCYDGHQEQSAFHH